MKYKPYDQDQGMALPPFIDDLIDENHLARAISKFVDNVDLKLLSKPFKNHNKSQGGSLPYNPRMMLKVLIYSYSQNIYTSRQIAKQVRENIVFMWLSGGQKPDFRTINRYRSVYFVDILPKVFTQLVIKLKDKGLVDFDEVFVDGTKIEADANKHKVVWDKSVKRYKQQVYERTKAFLKEVAKLDSEEMKRYGDLDLPEREALKSFTSSELTEMSEEIMKTLSVDGKQSKTKTGKALRKGANKLKEDAEKLKKYEQQEHDLKDKSSMSKTDPDAPVMKMKNDEFRPGYNVQEMRNNGFIVGTLVTQNANDGTSFIPLIEHGITESLPIPGTIIADAGYGHEEIYNYLEKKSINACIKYPSFHAEHSKQAQYNSHQSRFVYDELLDVYVCPQGKLLIYDHDEETTTKYGYVIQKKIYKCYECQGCHVKTECAKSQKGRTLSVSPKLKRMQAKVRKLLDSAEGANLYKRRGHEIETVFGDMKQNRKFRRFHVRGLEKVTAEVVLLALSFNLQKLNKLGLDVFIQILLKITTNISQKSQKWLSFASKLKVNVVIN